MKAVVQDAYGSTAVLGTRDIDKPEIGEDEVLVRVRAAGVNPGDWAIMSGLPFIARPVHGLRQPTNGGRARGGRGAGAAGAAAGRRARRACAAQCAGCGSQSAVFAGRTWRELAKPSAPA